MGLRWFEGFERGTGSVFEAGVSGTSYTATNNVSYPAGRTGGSCVNVLANTTTEATVTSYPGGAGFTEGVHGFGIDLHASVATQADWYQLREGTTVHARITFNASGQLVLKNGASTVLATSTTSFVPTAWNYIEVAFKIADSGGYLTVRVNEVEAVTFSGDTRNGGTAGAITNAYFYALDNTGWTLSVDDVYWVDSVDATATEGRPNNTFLGDVVVESLLPTGNGSENQWLGSDANSVDNYLLVDDASMTDYVGTGASGQRDNYAMADLSVAGLVYAVQPEALAALSDANAFGFDLQTTLKQGATEQIATAAPASSLTSSSIWYRTAKQAMDPTGALWDAAKVASIIAGVKTG